MSQTPFIINSGSNIIIQSGSINIPFGNVTANTFYGVFSGSIIDTGSINLPSGSNLTIQSGSIVPFALPASYVIFSGSISVVPGPFYALNGSNHKIQVIS